MTSPLISNQDRKFGGVKGADTGVCGIGTCIGNPTWTGTVYSVVTCSKSVIGVAAIREPGFLAGVGVLYFTDPLSESLIETLLFLSDMGVLGGFDRCDIRKEGRAEGGAGTWTGFVAAGSPLW